MKFSIVIHGGAGTILKEKMTPELETLYTQGLQSALDAGFSVLQKGGSAIDAVIAATVVLEDNILFNAGKGSVFGNGGEQEMDASIMDGSTLEAGAVAAVRNVRNPILLAKEIMINSEHVFLAGEGAAEFARSRNLKFENDEYFFSQQRYNQLLSAKESDEVMLDHSDRKFGTVGAVACDKNGNIAAATSTGGMTNKKFGRIGDSPMIGAGTYANNKTCAISATGHGELFIRAIAAYDVSAIMEYQGKSLQEAMDIVVHDKLMKIGGEGGLIGVDAKGNAAMVFNSEVMYRGMKNSDGLLKVAIYK